MLRHVLLGMYLSMLSLPALAQGDTIPVPPGVEVRGVPPIPASLAKDVAKYTGAYGYTLAGWDPVKREVRVKLLSNAPAIYRIESPGARPKIWKQLLVGNVYDLYPDPSERYIIYNKDVDGNEAYQMYLYDTKTYKSTLLSDPGSRNTEFVWSHTGDRVVYCRSKASEGPGVSLYMMDPRDPKTNRLLVKSDGNYLKAYDWSPDDRKVVVAEFYSQSESKLWVLDVISKERIMLSSSNGHKGYYGWPQFSKDGKGVYTITDHSSDARRLAYVDLQKQKYVFFTDGNGWGVEGYKLSPDGKRLIYSVNENGYSAIFLLDVLRGESRRMKSLPSGVVSGLVWQSDSREVAFNFKSSQRPCEIYSLNVESDLLDVWALSVSQGVNLAELPSPELINWNSFDGKKIYGFMYRPPQRYSGRRPVVICLHGGPADQYRPEYNYEHSYYINEMGVVWIYPNFRGSTGFGKKYLHSDDGLLREAATRDVLALIEWVGSQSDLDSDRIMVQGASYGGYLALSVAYRSSKKLACVRVDSGFANILNLLKGVEISRLQMQRGEFGDERVEKNRRFMEKIAPQYHLQEIQAPLLIIHGANDPITPIADARLVAQRVAQNHVPVWSIFASKEGHNAGSRESWDYQLYAGILFAKQYLLGR